eukprot:GSChrysophyteH1.ASY1.ANO1.2601.1 assembled CDS
MNAGEVVAPSLVGFGLCFIMVLFLQKRLDGYDKGNEVMQKLSKVIADGARQFLVTEYKYLAAFVTIRVDDNDGIRVAGCFIVGAILSAWAGWQGMAVATDANAKTTHAADKEGLNAALQNLAGFGFGASAIALFARVAGGIYTKAADVGADLVGKVEAGIPEDDPRNPAVIADNVGDNVGDVAGMGADLFESFVGSIIATVTLAGGDIRKIALPFWIAGVGVLSCFIGFWFVKTEDNASQKELLHALHKAIYVSGFLVVGLSALVCSLLFDNENEGWNYYGCILIGLLCGIVIGEMTEYCTSYSYFPVKSITDAGRTGPATVIIQASILACNALGGAGNNGQYGIAIAAVGMLSTLCMAECDEKVRDTTDALDALGNTTAATGKGFAIGSAVLTSVALLAAYYVEAGITDLNLGDPIVFSGILFGSMLPYLFAALTMLSVRKAAASIIEEVRRQFAQIPGLMEGTAEPESSKCVAICTACSVEEMVLPGTYAVLSPILIAIASGAMLGIMMSNAGGAWDNSKKYIEIEKACGGKGTDTHKACVIGDTVGDPFKDTSGPALNILIKLMSIIALTIAPLIAGNDSWSASEYGIIPLVLMIVVTIYQWYYYKDVEYKDSYAKVEGGETELTNKV